MTPAAAVYAGLVLARVGSFVAVLPPFAGRTPRTVRAGLALALAAFYVADVAPGWEPALAGRAADIHPLRYGVALVREALIGAAMGFAFGLFLLPARVAGEFVTVQIGLNVSPQVGVTGADSAGPLTNAFEAAGALVFLTADVHHVLLAALHASFAALPLGGTAVPQAGPMVTGLAAATEMGLVLAAPLALCLFLLAVTLAVMARAAPQLNIYSVGFTLQVVVVLVAGLFLLPEFVATLHALAGRTGENLPRVLGG
ncbi:flagellar biosynthesis protein : Flagellar biosynthetic protein fliR OS=Desulfotomaculum gibsoniae DSM 7213 GN=Desgi_2215 PE=3 SV=1: Bac_export_1 [Gemmataceae bacterium]|nr:flagellar biosynthesis protein : Flagellar biosynthetic protein fliR OS=Desulfotomaculum gibsoniae DSM 7213 GN=Desgi_2215 PE=3 SV=1: Bac_export_1 [Gemmataceae bacterium]VTT97904.1 flagellar biosynthesis protein : Flagellar biosynthetic protein fliR OS=Desulfotomaculum gibsoniae DSM 7213 GN=Desgi_2215 PE=3 SV=1: Bac_export_1 [Gemmataceae bacterium]